ncbi:MAG: 1-(5-phosphoribosyl)-5-[(5-phosphoribosylamino)methylideneamino]imidazole-4-carboxamide isomerase [Candidatus Anoxymicrobium japonicum]|uniref:1-(5-phosphoribosyl)-5-[(5-phosphoribosylamino)methylideneamino] imidazole-4-carboxamide isomerase n=1 Tax=Candidatus Anoxymicrobium japonicum TaxID=2013648 RepID=A0A2N3G6B3_9ACTN|nr:MAG: 1-(5-phosphoribosyl)-5-[(5-phosphoribosylamino)methylideneamino]imidazole-4-carboxamide isomerase [Candidatus Anoxymicrobium japonicum]
MTETTEFLVIPAVDIMGGRCVRLRRGLADEETVFDKDPARAALRWQEEGARLLHVVDLDGAFSGKPVNSGVIRDIASALSIPIEVGGGIRSSADAFSYVESGISRVVVGTAAFEDADFLAEVAGGLGERLAVGVDVKEGKVALRGWMGVSQEKPEAAIDRLASVGVRRIIYTDTTRDGTLHGPNFKGLEAIARVSPIPVIASGGVSAVEDITRVSQMSPLGIEGVIVGMALYKEHFTLGEAFAALRSA